MVKRHQKSVSAPKSWAHKRKKTVFITQPYNGAHSKETGIPLSLLLKDLLNFCKTTKEVTNILNTKHIIIDGVRRKNYKFQVGFTDIISIPDIKKHYVLTLDQKGRIMPKEIKEEEAKSKIVKVLDKKIIKEGKTQLNLSGGRNLLLDKNDYKVGDSLIVEIPKQTIKKHISLEKDAVVFLTGGRHVGITGTIEKIDGNIIKIKHDKEELTTTKNYAFVIGKNKQEVTM